MTYFKIIRDGSFVGIATSGDLRKFQQKHRVMLSGLEDDAQWVQYGDIYYHDEWMRPVAACPITYESADVTRIEKDEYDILFASIEAGKEIEIVTEADPVEDEIPVVDPHDVITLDYAISSKIAEMSARCNSAIVGGVDVTLSDGNTYHFSLKFSDQVNIMRLYDSAMRGETTLPYHADGALFVEYSAEDIKSIYGAMTSTILENTAYFNSLKAYINSLTDIESVSKIQYGTKIPSKYKSKVLKSLAK